MRIPSLGQSSIAICGSLIALVLVIGLMPDRNRTPVDQGDQGSLPGEDGFSVLNLSADNFVETELQGRAIYPVCSQRLDDNAPGGFGPSDNKPRRVAVAKEAAVYLLAEPDVELPYANGKKAMRLKLVNGSSKEVSFSACDSCLSIVQQTRDAEGNWRNIEYHPQSRCGNSYHTVFLSPGFGWQIPALRYKGPQTTMLRFAMTLDDASVIYSNEFEGSIHPDQFSVKVGHRATNVMDPYLD